MSGRQEEEESDKALMCEWGIWWESRMLVSSGHTKICSTERGNLGRSEDRRALHEVSEKVGMCKAGMPNPESSDSNFVAAGG